MNNSPATSSGKASDSQSNVPRWKAFRESLLPRTALTGGPDNYSTRLMPPELSRYLEELSPFFIQAVSGNDLTIRRGMLCPQTPPAVTSDGLEIYLPDSRLLKQFGANNLDQAAQTLNEVLIHVLNRVYREKEAEGFCRELQQSVIASRAPVVGELFPIPNGIGTAVNVNLQSFSVLLKLASRAGQLKEEHRDGIIRYHSGIVHGMALWNIKSITNFVAAVLAPKSPELYEFQKTILPQSTRKFISAEAESGDPWDLKHFTTEIDELSCPRLAIEPEFSGLARQLIKSPVAQPLGCPFKKKIPDLNREILSKAWDVMALPLIRGEISLD